MLIVYVTVPDLDFARKLGDTLVSEKLAACVNTIDGMESCYAWQGKIERGRECICLCKTTAERYEALEKRILELHPYETPCIVAFPVTHGHRPFIEWVCLESTPAGKKSAD